MGSMSEYILALIMLPVAVVNDAKQCLAVVNSHTFLYLAFLSIELFFDNGKRGKPSLRFYIFYHRHYYRF